MNFEEKRNVGRALLELCDSQPQLMNFKIREILQKRHINWHEVILTNDNRNYIQHYKDRIYDDQAIIFMLKRTKGESRLEVAYIDNAINNNNSINLGIFLNVVEFFEDIDYNYFLKTCEEAMESKLKIINNNQIKYCLSEIDDGVISYIVYDRLTYTILGQYYTTFYLYDDSYKKYKKYFKD